MRFQYASDLHLEMFKNRIHMEKFPLNPVGEILILAGDINYLADERLNFEKLFDLWSSQFEQVYIIPGNHEFYMKHFPIENIFPSFEASVKSLPNVHYLNNTVRIHGSVRLIFTTLFSVINLNPNAVKWYMNDFKVSKYHREHELSLTIDEYNECHSKCRSFLEDTLNQPFSGVTIVISHHVPYPSSLIQNYPRYSLDLSESFHVDMTYLMKEHKIDHWISGHTHFNHESIQIHNTMCHTNQLGYVENYEHKKFDRQAVIRIDD